MQATRLEPERLRTIGDGVAEEGKFSPGYLSRGAGRLVEDSPAVVLIHSGLSAARAVLAFIVSIAKAISLKRFCVSSVKSMMGSRDAIEESTVAEMLLPTHSPHTSSLTRAYTSGMEAKMRRDRARSCVRKCTLSPTLARRGLPTGKGAPHGGCRKARSGRWSTLR